MPSATHTTPRTPALLVQDSVRRLRAGQAVRVEGAGECVVVMAAEIMAEENGTGLLGRLPGEIKLALTGQRVAAITGSGATVAAFVVPVPNGTAATTVAGLIDPLAPLDGAARDLLGAAEPAPGLVGAALDLAKLGGLLPALVCLEGAAVGALTDTPTAVPLHALQTYRKLQGVNLHPVSEAQVPLADSEATRVVAFRPAGGGTEQFAIIIGEPTSRSAPLVRLHSECFTGDLLGSLRCDCGDQLRGAIRRMAQDGAGVLLYLAQEGRGIGLANKLRAYTLQDGGLDTLDANVHLGFEPDERDFWAAATMLGHLGIRRVRLLTNNPTKVEQLGRHGIEVAARVAHSFAANRHNHDYLVTKAVKSGHMLDPDASLNGDTGLTGDVGVNGSDGVLEPDTLPRLLRLI